MMTPSRSNERTSTLSLLLFCTVVLIWGSTWIAIKKQLGTVDPAVSVAYRFLFAAILMFLWTALRRVNMRFPLSSHALFALIGLLQYAVNYVFFYYASSHMVSGLVSLVFAASAAFNIVNGRIFLGTSISPRIAGASAIGLFGLFLVFARQITAAGESGGLIAGLILGLAGSLSFSLGNIASSKAQKAGLPVVQTTAWSMLYGGVLSLIGCLVTGQHFSISTSPTYLISLGYLSVFGSAVAFIAYLTLLQKIGADRAGYATILFPVISLIISTVYENYDWTAPAVIGVLLILAANSVIIVWPSARRQTRIPGSDTVIKSRSSNT